MTNIWTNGIDPADISVVIQGPVGKPGAECDVLKTVKSVTRLLPDAQIIVSTWKDQEYPGLADRCIVVRSDDPGGIPINDHYTWNGNRLIKSTKEGLARATRTYTLKLRGELVLTDLQLLSLPVESGNLLMQKIRTPNLFFVDPQKTPYLFHPADIAMFGRTSDLIQFWDQPLYSEKQIKGSGSLWSQFPSLNFPLKLLPEQAICQGWLRKHRLDPNLSSFCEASQLQLELWNSIVRHNFQIVPYAQSGILFPERWIKEAHKRKDLLDSAETTFSYLKVVHSKLCNKKMLAHVCHESLKQWGQQSKIGKVLYRYRKIVTEPIKKLFGV